MKNEIRIIKKSKMSIMFVNIVMGGLTIFMFIAIKFSIAAQIAFFATSSGIVASLFGLTTATFMFFKERNYGSSIRDQGLFISLYKNCYSRFNHCELLNNLDTSYLIAIYRVGPHFRFYMVGGYCWIFPRNDCHFLVYD